MKVTVDMISVFPTYNTGVKITEAENVKSKPTDDLPVIASRGECVTVTAVGNSYGEQSAALSAKGHSSSSFPPPIQRPPSPSYPLERSAWRHENTNNSLNTSLFATSLFTALSAS